MISVNPAAVGDPKPALARLLSRFPRVRIFIVYIFSLILTPRTLPLLAKLFRIKLPDAGKTTPGSLEQEVLNAVQQIAPEGNAQAVLDAIDNFVSEKGVLINIGDVKGALVESVVTRCQPKVALELGSYIGYSAITQARKLPPGGKLFGIELDPINAQVTREMVRHAGLSHKVEIIEGVLESSISELRKRGVSTVDYVLIDHASQFFLKDLLILQQSGLLRKGSVVVADNVLLPGAPDYRRYLATTPHFSTTEHVTDVSFSSWLCDIMTVSEFLG